MPPQYFNRYEDERSQGRELWCHRRDWLVWCCIRVGAILGGMIWAWLGFRLYGPNGAIGGALIGMVLGSVLGLVLPGLAVIALLIGAVYGVLWLLLHGQT